MAENDKKQNKIEILYKVALKSYRDGFLKKVLKKRLFASKSQAEALYKELEPLEHQIVEISVFLDGNEKTLKTKGNK